MSELDRVIGYAGIKKEVEKILDVLKNTEKYSEIGVTEPTGILLAGKPGIGKSLLSKAIAKESGRKTYIVSKNRPNGSFIEYITKTFEDAEKNAPSVVILDDMDKFANEDDWHRDAEEYVTIQSCIDDVKDKSVFVIATVNDYEKLPESLSRKGRFHKVFHMNFPQGKDAVKIIRYYLQKKNIAENLDAEEIARILPGRSCADLEAVINEAGIIAGNAGKQKIEQEDIMAACLDLIFGSSYEKIDSSKEKRHRAAVHEAGHAIAAEHLQPGSVSMISLRQKGTGANGFTLVNGWKNTNIESKEEKIIVSLAGKAATEIVTGENDIGAAGDLQKAYNKVRDMVTDLATCGFHAWREFDDSQHTKTNYNIIIRNELERYYMESKKILIKNRSLLDTIVEELMEKNTLTFKDIARIKNECKETLAD